MGKFVIIWFPVWIFAAFLFYWIIDWSWYPTDILSHKLLTEQAYPGQAIHIETLIQRYKSCNVKRNHVLKDEVTGHETFLTTDNHSVYAQSDVVTLRNIDIVPSDMKPGNYRYLIQVTFFCNPLDYFFSRTDLRDYGVLTVLPPKEIE